MVGPPSQSGVAAFTFVLKEAAVSERQIWITTFDLERLSSLIDGVRATGPQKKAYLGELEKELERARVVDPEKIPGDVITMNSVVRIRDLESGEETTVHAGLSGRCAHRGKPDLRPLGDRHGADRLPGRGHHRVEGPLRAETLRSRKILYQPEASGHYDR